MERIDLSAHGFFITPDIHFDWKTGKGSPFRYFTYGASYAEVEIDTLTGDFHTRAANVFLDLGHSINPAIDVGQVLFLSILLFSGHCFQLYLESLTCIFCVLKKNIILHEIPYLSIA